jgi:hypothetical protein
MNTMKSTIDIQIKINYHTQHTVLTEGSDEASTSPAASMAFHPTRLLDRALGIGSVELRNRPSKVRIMNTEIIVRKLMNEY